MTFSVTPDVPPVDGDGGEDFDSPLRGELADPTQGAGLVAYNAGDTYPNGTVGKTLQGLDQTLRANLADSSDVAKGAGLVAYNPALSYAAGTLGAEVHGLDAEVVAQGLIVNNLDDGTSAAHGAALVAFNSALDYAASAPASAGAELQAQHALRTNLPLIDNAAHGAGMVGFLKTLAYAANTVGKFLADLTKTGGAALIGVIQAGSTTARTLQDEMRARLTVDQFGADPTGATDSLAAFQAANAQGTALGGADIYLPGTYQLSATFSPGNKNRWYGRSKQGTVLNCMGTGDGIFINNPINSSTLVSLAFSRMTINAPNIGAKKGVIHDQGSSEPIFEDLLLNTAGGNANSFGLILDQTELCDPSKVYFAGPGNGLWLVNGTDLAPGASTYFTNRIKCGSCQFNVSGIPVVDDGGNDHTFDTCNFNAGTTWIRAAGVNGLVLRGGEWENCSSVGVTFKATRWQGAASITGSVAITDGGDWVQPLTTAVFSVDSGSLRHFIARGVTFNTGGTVFSGLDNCFMVQCRGNFQAGAGDGYTKINNDYSAQASASTWSGTIGNGTAVFTESRNGRDVFLNGVITMGTTTSFPGGNWTVALGVTSAGLMETGVARFNCAGGLYCGVVVCDSPTNSLTFLYTGNSANAVSNTVPATWAQNSSNVLSFSLRYTALHQIG